MEEDIKGYKTSDSALASYLVTKGMKVLGTVPHSRDPRRLVFVFVDHPERDEYVEEYLTGNDMVSASYYARTYKVIKKLIHEHQDKEE